MAEPDTAMTVVVPAELSRVILPLTCSAAVGLKDTAIAAFCPTAKFTGVFKPLIWKSLAFRVICERVTAVFPVLLTVTDCALELPAFTLEKVKLPGLAATVTVAAVPVPLSASRFGELGASLAILTAPLNAPLVVGVNKTENVAEPPAGTVAGVVRPLTL